jgi:hypothetical protein
MFLPVTCVMTKGHVHTHVHLMEGKCISTMISKCYILTLLVAKPCSSASRMWIGDPPPLPLTSYCHQDRNQEAQNLRDGLSPLPTHAYPTDCLMGLLHTIHRPFMWYNSFPHFLLPICFLLSSSSLLLLTFSSTICFSRSYPHSSPPFVLFLVSPFLLFILLIIPLSYFSYPAISPIPVPRYSSSLLKLRLLLVTFLLIWSLSICSSYSSSSCCSF